MKNYRAVIWILNIPRCRRLPVVADSSWQERIDFCSTKVFFCSTYRFSNSTNEKEVILRNVTPARFDLETFAVENAEIGAKKFKKLMVD